MKFNEKYLYVKLIDLQCYDRSFYMYKIFCVLFFLILIAGCKTIAKKNPVFSFAQLETSLLEKKGMDRLVAMHTGVFKLCLEDSSTYLTEQSKDSVYLVMQSVGEPARDGYWVYQELFLYNFYENPIATSFFKLTKISSDSTAMSVMEVPEGEKIAGKAAYFHPEIFQNLALKQAKGGDDCPMIWTKSQQLEFLGETDKCPVKEEEGLTQKINIQLTPQLYKAHVRDWESATDSVISDGFQIYKRVDESAFRKKYADKP